MQEKLNEILRSMHSLHQQAEFTDIDQIAAELRQILLVE